MNNVRYDAGMESPRIPRIGDTKFEVLATVVDHWANASFGPTVEEIRDAVGLSVRSSVQWHINDLLEDHYLERVPRKHRSIKPTEKGKRLVQILRELEDTYA